MNLNKGLKRVAAVFFGVIACLFAFLFIYTLNGEFPKNAPAYGVFSLIAIALYGACHWIINGFFPED